MRGISLEDMRDVATRQWSAQAEAEALEGALKDYKFLGFRMERGKTVRGRDGVTRTVPVTLTLADLVTKSGNLKGELQYLTPSQYERMTGAPPNKSILNKDGRVPWELALDEVADEYGYPSDEALKNDVEDYIKQKGKLEGLHREAAQLDAEYDQYKRHLGLLVQIATEAQKHGAISPNVDNQYSEWLEISGKLQDETASDQELDRWLAIGKRIINPITLNRGFAKENRVQIGGVLHDTFVYSADDLKAINEKRSLRSQLQDASQDNRRMLPVENPGKWINHPARYDVKGIDTRGSRPLPERSSRGRRITPIRPRISRR